MKIFINSTNNNLKIINKKSKRELILNEQRNK